MRAPKPEHVASLHEVEQNFSMSYLLRIRPDKVASGALTSSFRKRKTKELRAIHRKLGLLLRADPQNTPSVTWLDFSAVVFLPPRQPPRILKKKKQRPL